MSITCLKVYKRRFNCLKCSKRFTENNYINNKGKKLSLKLEQKVLMDLKEYMKDYKKYLKTVSSVISFDEFKADTRKGKLHKKTLDILPTKKR